MRGNKIDKKQIDIDDPKGFIYNSIDINKKLLKRNLVHSETRYKNHKDFSKYLQYFFNFFSIYYLL